MVSWLVASCTPQPGSSGIVTMYALSSGDHPMIWYRAEVFRRSWPAPHIADRSQHSRRCVTIALGEMGMQGDEVGERSGGRSALVNGALYDLYDTSWSLRPRKRPLGARQSCHTTTLQPEML